MDKDVYPLQAVGDAVNDKFISVKLQMDSTKNDAESIKQWYATAKEFAKIHSISGFPTYLFFSPDGEIIHKGLGFQKSDDFIRLIKDAQIPEKQLYTQIKQYREGKMDVNLVPAFIRLLDDGGDKAIASELARSYMKSYLEALSEQRFATKDNLGLMLSHQQTLRSSDRIYTLSLKKPIIVNNLYNDPFLADKIVTNILFYDVILPEFDKIKKSKKEPNWRSLETLLNQKSDTEHAGKILFEAQHSWYISIEDWDKACEYVIKKFQQKNLKNLPADQISWNLNETAWTLFEYSFIKEQLEQGVVWINEALALDESNHKIDPNRMDTKANLLYKLGRKEEAISLQEKAVSLLKKMDPEIEGNLKKMREGQPTWEIGVKENKQVR
jgi:hypothetical protein